MIEPEGDNPYHMQEFYPSSPISPGPSGGTSGEALINRLDGVSPRAAWFDYCFNAGFSFWTGVP